MDITVTITREGNDVHIQTDQHEIPCDYCAIIAGYFLQLAGKHSDQGWDAAIDATLKHATKLRDL